MSAGTETLGDALQEGNVQVWALFRRHRGDADAFEVVQWGRVLQEPAIGRSSSERLGGINARLVASGDVLLDEIEVGGVWGHWRRRP